MDTPQTPDSLSAAWWSRQAQALAAAKPAAVDERAVEVEDGRAQRARVDHRPGAASSRRIASITPL